eukprot:TRINITY_DN6469_c0_g2_i1.p1 TRINITY_DN6469_c0_g2~~TRINITY_DN6469_c0_g2_i1.p1  ORF type:complete len:407 (+),score=33.57 TRINITY_DN6469_c0_g2_i1:129-1223(+)
MSGVCKNGDNCRFSHDWSSEPNMICRYYLAGSCVYGDNCRYDHVKPGNQTQQASGYVPPQIPKPQIDEQDGAQKKGSTLNLNAKEWQQNPDTAVYDDQYEFNEDEFYADGDEFYEGEEFDPWNEEGGDQLPPDPAELPLCTEYLVVGHCQRDEDCPFIHGDFCEICQKYAIHPYNEEQQIEHVSDCSTRHEHVKARMLSAEVECGICLEKVMSKTDPAERKFGLMSCEHAFCLSCIRNWRQQGEKDGLEVETVRSCPLCRSTTHFITPSTTWPQTSEEKDSITSGYKNKLRDMDCKHFNFGEGKCPFGVSCFYKHAFKNGSLQDRENALRKTKNADGEVRIIQDQTLSSFLDTPQVNRLLRRRG